jgi:hypothetical protein
MRKSQGTDQKSGAAFCFLQFPETFEILTDGFGAERHAVREFSSPSDAGYQIQRITLG